MERSMSRLRSTPESMGESVLKAGAFLPGVQRLVLAIFCLLVIAVGFLVFLNECAFGGAMGAAYRECDCRGMELQLFDHTPADGPRKTVCIGLVRSTTCYQSRGGPEVACEP